MYFPSPKVIKCISLKLQFIAQIDNKTIVFFLNKGPSKRKKTHFPPSRYSSIYHVREKVKKDASKNKKTSRWTCKIFRSCTTMDLQALLFEE